MHVTILCAFRQHKYMAVSFLFRLRQIIKHLDENHYQHLLHLKASQCQLLRKPVQETCQSHDESLVLVPASNAAVSYRNEHHFCYLVAPIQETASQD